MVKDYYIVLGVTRGADLKKIKDAYRTVVKQYHPDLSGNLSTTDHFLEVKEAYETLSDEEKRKRYDVELAGEGSELRIRRVPEIVRERRSRFEGIQSLLSRTDDFFSGFLPGFFDVEKRKIGEKDLYFEAILTPKEAAEGGLFPVTVPVLESCPRFLPYVQGLWEGSGQARVFSLYSPRRKTWHGDHSFHGRYWPERHLPEHSRPHRDKS
jgi:DnaJ-class molecular chaperone